ncbi:MAG: hypothetical protein MST03_04165 [Bacteroidales bacterium]|nr:hypothetical protein [Bacteroidales bacterium]
MAENLRNKISQNFTKLLVVFKKNSLLVEKSCYLKEQNYTKLPKLFLVPETLFSLVKGIEGVLKRPQGNWNGLRPLGTRLGALNSWNARRAILYCLLAGDIICVLIRSALRRSAPWNARRGLVKNHYYTRATHGIVEAMWSNRGAFVERVFLFGVP